MQGTGQAVVLFGVKGPGITLKLARIETGNYRRDDIFFWTMKQRFKQCRRSLRYWLSIWRLSHCDFVKVDPQSMLTIFLY